MRSGEMKTAGGVVTRLADVCARWYPQTLVVCGVVLLIGMLL